MHDGDQQRRERGVALRPPRRRSGRAAAGRAPARRPRPRRSRRPPTAACSGRASKRSVHSSQSVTRPAAAESSTKTSPAPEVSPSQSSGTSQRTTISPASANAPATTPEPSARVLNLSTSSSSPARRESAPRKTAAMCAPGGDRRAAPTISEARRPARDLVAGRVAHGHRPPATRPRPRRGRTARAATTSANDGAERALLGDARGLAAQREGAAAQDDPERREEQRDRERRGDRAERAREAGPEDDQDEDQPDVVGLPDRCHRALDRARTARRARRRRRSGPRCRCRSPRRRAPRRPVSADQRHEDGGELREASAQTSIGRRASRRSITPAIAARLR